MANSGMLRFNPDRSLVEAVTPEGIEFGAVATTSADDNLIWFQDPDEPDNLYVACVGENEMLQPDTLYRLTPVETDVEEAAELETEA